MSKYKATISLFLSLICFGTIPLFLKYFTPYIDGWTANGYRYLVAAILYFPFLPRKNHLEEAGGNVWKYALIPTIFNLFLQSAWAWAPYYINPGLMGFLGKSTVIWSVMGSFIIFSDERPLLKSKRFWSGLLIAVTGFSGLSLGGAGIPREGTLFGIILVMISSMFMSAYMLSVRYYFKNTTSRTAFSVIALYTSIGTIVMMIFFGEPMAFTRLPLKINALIILSGIIGIGLAHVLYYAAQKVLGSAISSSTTLFSAFYTAFLSYLVFDEKLTMLQWISGLLVTAGGLLLLATQNKIKLADSLHN